MFQNPYGAELAGREPKAALAEAAEAVRTICQPFDASRWRRSYAPGKWTAAQILVHMAQIEMMFGVRARFGLTTGGYVVQVFEQDPFVEVEGAAVNGPTALNAFLALRAMNLQLFHALSSHQLAQEFVHPERGVITVANVIAHLAGHDWRHVEQLRNIQ